MSLWTQYPGLKFHWNAIVAAANTHKLDPVLVAAVVLKESSANSDAFRHEPNFWNRYMKLTPQFKGLNPRRYSSSYGLMQPMWVVATERGFPSDLPPELLFVPETGLDYGCRQLRLLTDWADTGWPQIAPQTRLEAILASYNGGRGGNTPGTALRNHSYARAVLALHALLVSERAGLP